MIRGKAPYIFGGTKQLAKTASYTVLYSDEEINVTPAANSVMTLPKISDLAGNGLGAKAYKFTKEGTGRYSVEIAANAADKILIGGSEASSIFLTANGEEVVIQSDPVMKQWRILHSGVGAFMEISLQDGKYSNISIRTRALTGQINGMEINMTGPNGAATGANSYQAFRVVNYIVGTNIMTARGAFIGVYSHEVTTAVFSGQMVGLTVEVGNARAADAVTTGCLELCSRGAQLSATYHNFSAYIQIRDYHASLLGVGALPNLFSFMDANLAWTPATLSASALISTYTDAAACADHHSHSIKISIAGVSYWIPLLDTAPH